MMRPLRTARASAMESRGSTVMMRPLTSTRSAPRSSAATVAAPVIQRQELSSAVTRRGDIFMGTLNRRPMKLPTRVWGVARVATLDSSRGALLSSVPAGCLRRLTRFEDGAVRNPGTVSSKTSTDTATFVRAILAG